MLIPAIVLGIVLIVSLAIGGVFSQD